MAIKGSNTSYLETFCKMFCRILYLNCYNVDMGRLVHQHLSSSLADGNVEKANYFSFCMLFFQFPQMPLLWGSVDQRHEEVLSWKWSVLLIRRLQKVASIAPNHSWVVCRHLSRNTSLLGMVNWSWFCWQYRYRTSFLSGETSVVLNISSNKVFL